MTQPTRLCLVSLLTALFGAAGEASAQNEASAEARTNTLGMQFVAVPNTPVLFARHEVRVSEWQEFLTASGYSWSYRPHFEQGPDHPAVGITLQDARAFCSWLSEKERKEGKINAAQAYRLPTVEDWDAAIGLSASSNPNLTVEERLAEERRLPWGDDWPPPAKSGNYADAEIEGYEDGFPFTSPVGSFTPTKDGLHDLSGNVWEWCWNPALQVQETATLRGGSWAYFRRDTLIAGFRYQVPMDLRMPTIGFRVVFEDKDRNATLLAAAQAAEGKILAERRKELMGSDIDKAAVEAVRKSLSASGPISSRPNPATLTPASPGRRHTNVLGMDLLPIGDSSVLLGQLEVTVQQWQDFLSKTSRTWPNKPSFTQGESHPVVGITWQEAQAFCDWLTTEDQAAKLIPAVAKYRLPSDLEWSQAAGLPQESGSDPAQRDRADKLHYPWSPTGAFPPRPLSVNLDASRLPDFNDSYPYTAPASTEAPNPAGFVGLGGNAAEWCADSWPGAPDERVIRGGSWQSFEREALLTSARRHGRADQAFIDVGFRCVLELPPGS